MEACGFGIGRVATISSNLKLLFSQVNNKLLLFLCLYIVGPKD